MAPGPLAWGVGPASADPGGPAGPGGAASGRGRPGLICRGAGIGVLGVRDGVLPQGGREWKRGHSRHRGVHGLGRTEVPRVHCTFPRVPFESGATRNITTKHPPPPSHSRHQSWWAQGGDSKETPRQHHPGRSEQRAPGRGAGVTGCPHHYC